MILSALFVVTLGLFLLVRPESVAQPGAVSVTPRTTIARTTSTTEP
ncbi:MAG: hypothetical protein QOJ71_1687, partial [Actinomycetota bacterium]|nr:hypothetical protein [Actinomycetota bacterium]